MSPKVENLPRQANPSIHEALEHFLKDQRERLKPRTVAKSERVVELLESYLNGYAYQSRSRAEARLFDEHFNARATNIVSSPSFSGRISSWST